MWLLLASCWLAAAAARACFALPASCRPCVAAARPSRAAGGLLVRERKQPKQERAGLRAAWLHHQPAQENAVR